MVEGHYLDALRALGPSQPRYFDAKRQSGKLISQWNLIVPFFLLSRNWEEVP